MKYIIFILLLSFSFFENVLSQLPETDIFICTMQKVKDTLLFSRPINITNRKGYDNQPCFTKDGNKILFVAVEDTNQSDIYVYDLTKKSISQFTNSKESEYSPAYTPDKKFISVVRVDADSGQRFYKLPESDWHKAEHIKNTDSIGYFCWLNDTMLAMFILGPSNTLQVLNTNTSERKLIASDVGRCLKLSPDKKSLYFILKSNADEWYIYSMALGSKKLTKIAQTLPGNEDFTFLPDGTIIMGKDAILYKLDKTNTWKKIADFTLDLPGFYRIVINEKGTMMALVAYTGKKP
jgi:hypothetical protein